MTASQTLAHLLATYHPTTIEFVGTHCVQLLFFWIPSAIYLGIHSFFPKFSTAHKLQPGEKQPTSKEFTYCLRIVMRNQLMSSTFHLLILVAHRMSTHSSLPPLHAHPRGPLLPLAPGLAHPLLYASISEFHHKFTTPVALAAQFAHPVEHLVSNILPMLLPPQLLWCYVFTWWIFLGIELLGTTTFHSGYDFFWGGRTICIMSSSE